MIEPPGPLPEGAVLLHIGPHKTGTTAIQTTLAPARTELAAHGVDYPGRHIAHHLEARALRRHAEGWSHTASPVPPKRVWKRFARNVAKSPDTVVISSEYFAGCDEAQRAAVASALGPERLHILIGARNPASLALSTWQQLLREGKTTSLNAWLETDFHRPEPVVASSGFWSRADAATLAEEWRGVVEADRITVVVVDEDDKTLLPTTFEGLLGLPPGLLVDRRPAHSNRGITAVEAELVQHVNQQCGPEMSWADHSALIRGGLVRRLQDVRRPPLDEPRAVLPAWAVGQAEAEADFVIDRLQQSGVGLIGDVADLRKVPASGDPQAVAAFPTDLVVEAAVGVVRGALKRARALEQEVQRQQVEPPDVGEEPLRSVDQVPTKELVGLLRSRVTSGIGRRLGR